MDFINDIAVGAVTQGTNLPTFILLNCCLLAVVFCLIFLLAFSLTANPALVPHVLVLIFLAIGLWGLMIWLIGVVGVVDSSSSSDSKGGEGLAQQEAAAAATAAGDSAKKQS
jgi:predicted MFS family arabinose efflux permease